VHQWSPPRCFQIFHPTALSLCWPDQNPNPPVRLQPQGWMISSHETVFCWVPVPYLTTVVSYLSCIFFWGCLPTSNQIHKVLFTFDWDHTRVVSSCVMLMSQNQAKLTQWKSSQLFMWYK
jgi:hypothetical protein